MTRRGRVKLAIEAAGAAVVLVALVLAATARAEEATTRTPPVVPKKIPPARGTPAPTVTTAPATSSAPTPWLALDAPYHGSPDAIAFGAQGEIRFGHDRVRGIENPEWLSFPRISGFVVAQVHPRLRLVTDFGYDRAVDELTLEQALADVYLGKSWFAHVGVLLPPLGRENLEHNAPANEFADRSLVADQLVGVPVSMFGVGVHGERRGSPGSAMSYELDLVNGYDDGVVTEASPGTRVPSGRNTAGDNNGVPAAVGRVAWKKPGGRELGIAAYAGQYNTTSLDGVTLDSRRYLTMGVADASMRVAGLDLKSEIGVVFVDVPPSLRAVFPEEQWGAAVEVSRPLFAPLLRSLPSSSLSLAIRADAVDFDRSLAGDSTQRISAALNIRPSRRAVVRGTWSYEVRRDRFANETPAAGVAATAAMYF